MNDLIRIGAGNKTFDLLNLGINAVVIILLSGLAFFNRNWLYFLAIFILVSGFHTLSAMERHYVFIQGDHFIIDHIVKPSVLIKKDLYKGISRPLLSIPFSNELIIHFKDGKSFRMMGGVSKIEELEKRITG